MRLNFRTTTLEGQIRRADKYLCGNKNKEETDCPHCFRKGQIRRADKYLCGNKNKEETDCPHCFRTGVHLLTGLLRCEKVYNSTTVLLLIVLIASGQESISLQDCCDVRKCIIPPRFCYRQTVTVN
ncbi:hypothetical protein QE152_g13339 [Popillia japonica]|uniref:TNFR-Cys domain-containing protein n=1 Tax=Popillia japonica TaxID=7064 RepID=A0AAW1L9X2_POPJA